MQTSRTRSSRALRVGVVAPVLVAAVLLVAAPAWGQTSFFIDESLDFTGNGCPNSDLNDVSGSLQTRLAAAGWTGQRWVNADAWTTDFMDEAIVSGGSEGWATDSHLLDVYAGHGFMNNLQYGFPRLGTCNVTPSSQTRLGTLTGNVGSYAIYMTSCTMRIDSIGFLFSNEVYQQFGYHNSPSIFGGSAGDFFDDTGVMRNELAWLERMDDRWGIGWNSPVALTFAPTQSQCVAFQTNARLKSGVLRGPAPEPWAFFCYNYRDNGCGGCGGTC